MISTMEVASENILVQNTQPNVVYGFFDSSNGGTSFVFISRLELIERLRGKSIDWFVEEAKRYDENKYCDPNDGDASWLDKTEPHRDGNRFQASINYLTICQKIYLELKRI